MPDTMTQEMDDALDGGLKNKDPEEQGSGEALPRAA